ncbi:MAG: hydrogenase iron-sulfur subunit, partial [SAR202 cluster bacterium]|nr:hydrogenase iron-sulfur subunit [SAR202 cluster bacterium]
MVKLQESGVSPATAEDKTTWEPTVVALVCNWCTYSGADMAGTARRAYAPNVRIVRLLCTGRIDPLFILKAFEQGADGVIVSGCHPGDCHYVQGNLLTRRRHTVYSALMDFLGLDQRRLHYAWVSASEGVKWANVVNEATEAVREAGPLLNWGKPGNVDTDQLLQLLEAVEEPRDAPSPETNDRISAHLQETAANLLAEGEVSMVIGYSQGSLPGQTVPMFVTDPEQASNLVWNERCENNLTVYIPTMMKKKDDKKVGIVVKKCDAKALIGLMRENQLSREDVAVLSAPCAGLWQDGKLAAKCFSCTGEASPL